MDGIIRAGWGGEAAVRAALVGENRSLQGQRGTSPPKMRRRKKRKTWEQMIYEFINLCLLYSCFFCSPKSRRCNTTAVSSDQASRPMSANKLRDQRPGPVPTPNRPRLSPKSFKEKTVALLVFNRPPSKTVIKMS